MAISNPIDRDFKPATTTLEVDAIEVFYGPIQALRGLSLKVGEKEMVALVGANGAGKTTTLRTIAGLLSPTRGRIALEGQQVQGMAPQQIVERGIAHLPEGRDLFPSLSVTENLQLGAWVKRKQSGSYKRNRDKVMDFFPKLRQREHQAAGTLSGGEQQMLVIARALMSEPKLLVVDELSLGLAPMIVQQLFDILRQVNSEGTAILLVEQFVHMALENTHRAYALAKGDVVIEGRSDKLLGNPELIAAYLGSQAKKPEDAGDPVVARAKAPKP
ncbi:MAG: ABC transporter ATP-binding protein [Candidatus Dormibacteria bacterium]